MLDVDRERALEPLGAAGEPLQDELARTAARGRDRRRRARAPRLRPLGGLLGRLARFERARREIFGLEAQLGERLRAASPVRPPARRSAASARASASATRAAKLRLARGDPVQVAGQAARTLGERGLQAARRGRHNPQGLIEPFGAGDDAGEPRGVGAAHVAQMSDRREPLGGCARLFGGPLAARPRLGRARCKLVHLAAQLAAARVELEENGLGGLACEPELAVLRVPADPLGGHGRDLRREQFVRRRRARSTSSRGSRPTSTSTEPRPAAFAFSISSSPRAGWAASTAEARCPSAAAVERSAPASTSSS